ncbi:MAG TPA: hypothetical protein VG308_17665 [Stellaceae bacterium]|jgi:hypothetical protein|nr:hypothetical protein [Stellaceae bacterium]
MSEVYMLQPVTPACHLFRPGRRAVLAEPALDELMGDPMTLALMAADRVDRSALQELLREVGDSLR